LKKIIIDQETFALRMMIERETRSQIKDCFSSPDELIVIVAAGQMGKALGKGGQNVKRLQEKLRRKIKFIEFSPNIATFVRNLVKPIRIAEIVHEDTILFLRDPSKKTKSLLIGRGGKNLLTLQRAVSRFFNVEIKIE